MGAALPGSTCVTRGFDVDASTLSVTCIPSPGPAGRQALLVLLAAGEALRQARQLQHKIDVTIDEIETTKEYAKKLAAYEFFSAFFDHYLPKRFLWHYIWQHGHEFKLTEQQMIDCNPVIAPMRCAMLRTTLEQLQAAGRPDTVPLTLACPASAWTNGTLGQFTVLMNGTLEYRSISEWVYAGTMSFADTWNFDPKDFETGGRSVMGEIKTRFAYYTLPGDPFKITSVETAFTYAATGDELQQGHLRRTVEWKGGLPRQELDRVSQADVRVTTD
jgi:hypothetical protein